MKESTTLHDLRTPAISTGIAIILMALAAGFSLAYVLNNIFVEGNPSVTLANLQASTGMYRAGIGGWLLVFVCDLVAAWGLHMCFSRFTPRLSLLTAWLRVAYTLVLGVAISRLVDVLPWLSQTGGGLSTAMIEAQASNSIESFNAIWSMGLIVFGLHLLSLGWMTLSSTTLPKWCSVMLLVAGIAYFGINALKLLFPSLESLTDSFEIALGVPMAVAELALAGWLLWKGGKV